MDKYALDNIKRLRDVLTEAITAMEAGRNVKVEEKLPYGGMWHEVTVFRDRDYRCTFKPREMWMNSHDGVLSEYAYAAREAAMKDARHNCETIRFVEAPPEDNQ